MVRSLILVFRVASDLEPESVLRLLINRWRLLFAFLFLVFLFLHLVVILLLFINLFDLLVLEFLLLLFLGHLFIELLLVLLAVDDVFLFHLVLHDQNLFYLLNELALDLSDSLLDGAAWTCKFLAALFAKILWVNTVNAQSADGCYVFMLTSTFSVDNNIFVLHCFLFLLLFWCLLFFCLLDLLLNGNNILLFELWMVLNDLCWSQIIKSLYTQVGILAILAQLEWVAAR